MKRFKAGFTLAEVLITLSIIGIIAAIVMPSVVASYQYKSIGVKLAKFMSATEQASRAYVVQDDAFATRLANSAKLLSQADQFMNDSFLMTRTKGITPSKAEYCAGKTGTALTTCQTQYDNTTDKSSLSSNFSIGTTVKDTYTQTAKSDFGVIDLDSTNALQESRALLKDGTKISAYPITAATAYTAYQNNDSIKTLVDSYKMGYPVFTIKFDPNVSGLPETVHRSFWFNVTELGYVVPSAYDTCLIDIFNADFKTTTNLFKSGGNCNNLTR